MVATHVGSNYTDTLVTREANPIRVGGRDVCVTFTIKGGHASYGVAALFLGLARPGLEPRDGKDYAVSGESRAWWMDANGGRLFGSGKANDDYAGALRAGDRLTVVLTAGGGSGSGSTGRSVGVVGPLGASKAARWWCRRCICTRMARA